MVWEISDKDISSACENEFDGQDEFLLVQEILEDRKEIKQLQAELKTITTERNILAMLSADKLKFFNRFGIVKAKKLRDRILKDGE